MAARSEKAVADEQAHLDLALKFREARRKALCEGLIDRATAGGVGAWQTQGPAADVLRELGPEDSATAFGRLDIEGDSLCIGRTVIFDDARDPVVISWKSTFGQVYYTATLSDPKGVLRRRAFSLADDPTSSYATNEILDVTDELLGESVGDEPSDVPSDALLRELARVRSGEMRDIVATIQSHQYSLIAATADRPLLIQGGPGTGKTAVALHRVSWLLNDRRDRGWRPDDVLIVGPTKAFTRYIRNVLPALGDRGVSQTDLGGLAPSGVQTGRPEDPGTARLKGELRMTRLLERAVWARISIPDRVEQISYRSVRVRLSPDELQTAVEASRPQGYGNGREYLARLILDRVNAGLGPGEPRAERREVGRVVDRVWPRVTPAAVLRELLGSERRLVDAAGEDFTAAEIRQLHRPSGERKAEEQFSVADAALLDELEMLLGADRVKRYRHVVVDEAQDLSPMQLRAVNRRVTSRSITLLGDVAQSTGPHPIARWDEVTGVFGDVEYAELAVGYRIPAAVSAFAAQLMPRIAPSLTPPEAVREVPDSLALVETNDDPVAVAISEVKRRVDGSRSIALVVSFSDLEKASGELERNGIEWRRVDEEPGPSVTLLTPRQAKGLEFDVVCVAAPETIAASGLIGLRELFVAYTRPTSELVVVHEGDPLGEMVEIESIAPLADPSGGSMQPGGLGAGSEDVASDPVVAALGSIHDDSTKRVALVAAGRVAEFSSDRDLALAVVLLAGLRAGSGSLSALGARYPAAVVDVVRGSDGLLSGLATGASADGGTAVVAGAWVVGALSELDTLTQPERTALRTLSGEVVGLLRSNTEVPAALGEVITRALLL